jgi:hypothetical protein
MSELVQHWAHTERVGRIQPQQLVRGGHGGSPIVTAQLLLEQSQQAAQRGPVFLDSPG